MHLLESSLIRVGNDEYAKSNGSFGLTTLRDRHVRFDAGEMRFSFSGKSGKDHAIIGARRAARRASCARAATSRANVCSSTSTTTASAARSTRPTSTSTCATATGSEFTAKDFRTWIGTLLAAVALEALDVPESDAEGRRNATLAITAVSKRLGNTPTVARNSYVHPDIVDLYLDGRLQRGLAAAGPRATVATSSPRRSGSSPC